LLKKDESLNYDECEMELIEEDNSHSFKRSYRVIIQKYTNKGFSLKDIKLSSSERYRYIAMLFFKKKEKKK